MLITTTPTIEGKRIVKYLGLVNGESIIGANLFRDFLASITDIIGGRSKAYEDALVATRKAAIDEMIEFAQEKGANAVIGVDIDYETITINKGGTMMMVSVAGTAVRIE
ncbi:YbjQ family protein [bacterium]|nr:YbjQ family protein [bacterium]